MQKNITSFFIMVLIVVMVLTTILGHGYYDFLEEGVWWTDTIYKACITGLFVMIYTYNAYGNKVWDMESMLFTQTGKIENQEVSVKHVEMQMDKLLQELNNLKTGQAELLKEVADLKRQI